MSNRKKLKPWRDRPIAIQESAASSTLSPLGVSPTAATLPPRREQVRETASVVSGGNAGSGRLLVKVISAGWSLNNVYYGADVLREAARRKRWANKCHVYADHATDAEEEAHPSGSIRNLAGGLSTDAWWDEDQQALMAEVEIFPAWKETIAAMAPYIGMSIRAWVTGEDGQAEGRAGFVVHSIAEGRSVDLVTVPAAGGAIVSVLESLRTVAEAPTEEIREALSNAVRASHAFDEDTYAYVRDFDPDRQVVWFEVGSNGSTKTWQQPYQMSGAVASLSGEPIEVVARMRYEPVNPPAQAAEAEQPAEPDVVVHEVTETAATEHEQDQAPTPVVESVAPEDVTDGAPPTAPPSTEQEPAMSGQSTGAPPVEAGTAPVVETPAVVTTESTQPAPVQPDFTAAIAEAIRAAQAPLLEQVQQMQAREAQRDAATRADQNRNRAREAVDAALRADDLGDVRAQIGPRVTGTVLASVPTTAEGAVDEAALATAVSTAVAAEAAFVRGLRAEALESAGVGSVFGLGGEPAAEAEKDTSGVDDALKGLFETIGLTEAQVAVATKGRAV